jgi:hypothetical protein
MINYALAAAVAVAPAAPTSIAAFLKAASSARPASSCQVVRPVHAGGTQGYADQMGSGSCFVSVSPNDSNGLVYRNYGVFSDGLFMVFNSFGDSEDTAKDTGAREFHFFPRAGVPLLHIDAAAPSVSVTLGDGGTVVFDPATAQPVSSDRGTVTVAGSVDRGNKGGVEFPSYAGLMLDSGFRMGELPSGKPNAESVFRDAAGKTCALKNNELFAYAGGDRTFKFDDAALKTFLAARCPALAPGY